MDKFVVLCILTFLTSVPHSWATCTLDATNVEESCYVELLGRVRNLERRDKEQQEEISKLQSELNVERQRTSILEGLVSTLTWKANFVKQEMMEVDQSNEPDPNDVREDVNTTGTESVEVKDHQSSRIRRQADIPVTAFHITLKNDLSHTGAHQSIAFDNVITNIGGAFNLQDSTFVAPVSGVYVFYSKLLGYTNDYFSASIVKNGNSVANLYVRDRETAIGNDCAMAVLHLNKGDIVVVQNLNADTKITGNQYSMFSGFLLHADTPAGIFTK